MPTGYCTVDDVRRALRSKDLPGDAAQDRDIVIDAIASQSEWLQETTNRHWYESGGVTEDSDGLIPSGPLTHDEDEQDIPTRAFLTTEPETRENNFLFDTNDADEYIESGGLEPRPFRGPFTRITLFRRDASTLSELLVLHSENGYEDWVADSGKTEGRAGDYYLHVDSSTGLSRLYINTETLDSELENYSAAVVATYDYGIDGITRTVRRAVAMKAAAQLLTDDEASLGIPDSGQLQPAESKIQALERQAEELLGIHE